MPPNSGPPRVQGAKRLANSRYLPSTAAGEETLALRPPDGAGGGALSGAAPTEGGEPPVGEVGLHDLVAAEFRGSWREAGGVRWTGRRAGGRTSGPARGCPL